MNQKTKIVVVGSGYVGMSLSVLLSQEHKVVVLDIDQQRVEKINRNETTIVDSDITDFLKNHSLDICATSDPNEAFPNADIVVIATPTNYDPETNAFDTSSVDSVVELSHELCRKALIVIKSTIPIGHSKKLRNKFNTQNIIFSPEFLREGQALYDNLYPSRIIVGGQCDQSRRFGEILASCARTDEVALLFMDSTEAEAVKLFSNTYLAMRVAYFNELDSFALAKNLDVRSIVDGVIADPRIGTHYCNPSLGYGGYCLPKDTKQLHSNFDGIPQNLISAIVESNVTRVKFMAENLMLKSPNVVGFYGLGMKSGSDNFRSAAILQVMDLISMEDCKMQIYEPSILVDSFSGIPVITDLAMFLSSSDIIVSNRMHDDLLGFSGKVLCRDIYGSD